MTEKTPIDFGEFLHNSQSTRVITLEFFPQLANFWEPAFQYALDAFVRPSRATGFAYQATAGQSGEDEPAWPTKLGQQVKDGSIVWTCVAAGGNGVQALSSPAVVADPSTGLTIGAPQILDGAGANSAVSFSIEDGDMGGYDLRCDVSAGSEALQGILRVTVDPT